jgi:hypothetical protein
MHCVLDATWSFDPLVIFGDCPTGADALALKWAKQKSVSHHIYPADWDKYGKQAGPIRNAQMAEACTRAIAFWDGKSRGTKSAINEVIKRGKPIDIYVRPK